MPAISNAPGLKRGRILKDGTPLWYWMAKQIVRDPRGFPDRCIPLPRGASDDALAELCREHTASLMAWLDRLDAEPEPAADEQLVDAYDGTMQAAIALYRGHSLSPFNEVKANTRRTYNESLKVLEATIAKRLIRNLTVVDAKRWYKLWRAPAAAGGPERIDRAHDAISMVRQVVGWGASLGKKDCAQFAKRLGKNRFEKGSGREEEMTYPQAVAFVRMALELSERGVIPADRGLHMGIGVAAQFELCLRQTDIIGEWTAAVLETPHATYDGAGEMWLGPFRWDNVPGWRFRLKTSKTRAASGFNLADYPLLFPLLERVPPQARVGAIVKGEHDLPVRARSYRKWFREIARAAGIPDQVWSMDSRAGAATEADLAGVDFKLIQGLLTHSERQPGMTEHYIRQRTRGNSEVARARVAHRAKQEGGGE